MENQGNSNREAVTNEEEEAVTIGVVERITKKNMEMKNQESESDRLISLPETLIHHIFALASIDIKQAIRMSVLSTNWRYFWKSLPSININLGYGADQSFISNVITLHNAAHVHTLFLKSQYVTIGVELVDKLIDFSITRHVQQVHIEGKSIKMSKSALELLFKQSEHIKTLKLLHFYLVDKEQKELELRSSTLENLVLWVYHKCDCVTIDCPQLDYLMIHNSSTDPCGLCKAREVNICAPKLSRIHIQGVLCNYSLEGLSSMIDAHLDIFDTYRNLFSNCLDSFLRLVSSIKSLTLNPYLFQEYGTSLICRDEVHGGVRFLWAAVQVSFPNLKYLKVVEWDTNNRIMAFAKFIEIFSSIETLVLESNQGYESDSSDEDGMGGYKGLNWAEQLAFKSNYHKLKSFHIQFINGGENELKFIDYILKSALALENITITMGKHH